MNTDNKYLNNPLIANCKTHRANGECKDCSQYERCLFQMSQNGVLLNLEQKDVKSFAEILVAGTLTAKAEISRELMAKIRELLKQLWSQT